MLLSGYKFYCTLQMAPLHAARQQNYISCIKEINTHPNDLFIGADAFPLEAMDAKPLRQIPIPAHNLFDRMVCLYARLSNNVERYRLKT